MKKRALTILLAGILALSTGCGGKQLLQPTEGVPPLPVESWEVSQPTEAPQTTEAAQPVETVPPTTQPEETVPPTTQPPQPEEFVLTFAGDCTLGSDKRTYGAMYSFIWTIGEDYDFPFRNVVEYFRDDDLTMVNLEGVLADSGTPGNGTFSFRGPTAYTQILTGSSVEAVAFANNHTMDYYQAGYDSTCQALENAGIPYVEKDQTMLYTTESGLTVGFCAAWQVVDVELVTQQVQQLRQQGAEIVVMALHWGVEASYRAGAEQEKLAHQLIDAGVDVVYGSHPHVLQKIECYGNGIIYYSLGNFSFGGHHWPRDLDSVVVRQHVIRETDGSVHLGDTELIPVSISSTPPSNNFQPTPYEVDSEEYQRVLDKLGVTEARFSPAP